jgi:para-aminobenzoate synthetase/4-amino-4-deoxychorismate lyase
MKPWHPLPAEVYALVEQTPGTVLLETSRPGATNPVSRLFTSPRKLIEATDSAQLSDLFAQVEDAIAAGYFAAGFFAYECGQVFEPAASVQSRSTHGSPATPLAWLGIYERCYRFHHATGRFLDGELPGLAPADPVGSPKDPPETARFSLSSALTEEQYTSRIEVIQDWIRAGDVYQLNFTFPLCATIVERPASLYERLRTRQPVEYGAFLHLQSGRHILSFSPELFFRIEKQGKSRRIATRPMKGTARRGRTTREDRQIAEWLRNDEKNRSENVMIVDLIRNDLGRLCTFGSVRVESLFDVERFPSLWQMTSTVTGELRADVACREIFRALFPCGSITGAPKVRAMQLLAQIEGEPRGVYSGAIGYFSGEESVFNVAIRTVEVNGQDAKMVVGGGIVIDSVAAEEFRECQLKAEFLTRTQAPFSLIETLLWRDGYPLLELHLDRLKDSAGYFDIGCDRDAVKMKLSAIAGEFSNREPRKVRLLLDSDGKLSIDSEPLSVASDNDTEFPCQVCIALQRTDPGDRFLFHKTTNRTVYNDAFKAASKDGFDDVLFLNSRGEVTEGAIGNVFIEKGGRWFTPPIECGVLPGVYRRHLLETRSDIEERILTLADIESADAIYLTNAVRGLRRAAIDFGKKESGSTSAEIQRSGIDADSPRRPE